MHVPCLSLAIPRPARDQHLCNSSHSLRRFRLSLYLVVTSFISFTDEQIANAPKLEPSLEGLLLSANVKPQIIDAFRVQEITSVNLMVALDSTEEGFMKTCKQAFEIDTEAGDFAHKREWAKLNMVWKQARITCDTKDRVDAVKRAHGEPVSFLTADWVSLLRQFKQQRGKIQDSELPAQSYYEAFEESLHDGTIQAETLPHVVSIAEEQNQRANRPEPPKQLGLHLDSTLTVQTKRRYMSSIPSTTEALRTKYEVLSNLWLLEQSRQPGRKMYADFTENTWQKFLKELLNEDNFGLQREIQGEVWATPAWTHCLEYEYQLRKEALRLCFEDGYSIQEALWSAYADPQLRMKHWIQLLAVANSKSSSSNADQQKIATLERRTAELERKIRSGPPPQRAIKGTSKGKRNKGAPLAIQDISPAQKGGYKSKAIKGKGNKGKADKSKGNKGKGTGQGSLFDILMASPGALQKLHRRIKTRRVSATTFSHAGATTKRA